MIPAACHQLKQLKKQPEKKSGLNGNNGIMNNGSCSVSVIGLIFKGMQIEFEQQITAVWKTTVSSASLIFRSLTPQLSLSFDVAGFTRKVGTPKFKMA